MKTTIDKLDEVIETLEQMKYFLESYYLEEYEDFAANILALDVILPLEDIKSEIEDSCERNFHVNGAI